MRSKRTDLIAKTAMILSGIALVWLWGVMSVIRQMFPYPQIRDIVTQSDAAMTVLLEQANVLLPFYYTKTPDSSGPVTVYDPESVAPGLILVSHMIADGNEVVRIIDDQAHVLHEWNIDWFSLWPNPTHLDFESTPKSKPGTSIHGIQLMPNGDLVFNFENLGLIRVDACGNVVWRLPYHTHHSVEVDDSGNIWVSGKIIHRTPDAHFPNFVPNFQEYTILRVSPDGRILDEISVYDLLMQNNLPGLLYLASTNNYGTRVSGDTLHLNDVEPFPSRLEPGVFEPGDVMISLRNINAIIVFSAESRKIKYVNIGTVLRQHDPDFVSGNEISVLDNHNLSSAGGPAPLDTSGQSSRLLLIDARTGDSKVLFEGTAEHPFFTDIMGKHQWLANGDIMVADAREGRSFELSPSGKIVWEYHSNAGDGLVGLIDDTQRLPASIDRDTVAGFSRACRASSDGGPK